MKRFIIALLAVVAAVNVSAQELRIGAAGAVNFAWERTKALDIPVSSDTYLGFHAGVKVDYDLAQYIANGFYAEASLLYNLKGNSYAGVHTNLGYLQLPLNFGYKYPLTNSIALLGSLGPYIGVGVLGNDVVEDGDTKIKTDVFGVDYQRFDFGLNYKLGVEMWNMWQFYFGFEHSLLNIAKTYKDVDDDMSSRLLTFYIGTAYMF